MNKQMTYTRADGHKFEYNGSLTINVYRGDRNVDCYTIGWPADQHSISDIVNTMDEWEVYYED